MAKEIEPTGLVNALECVITRNYDRDLRRYNVANRFKWATLASVLLAAVLTIFGVRDWNVGVAVLAAMAALGWLTSRAEWEAAHGDMAVLHEGLAEAGIFIGGRGREIRLTTNPYDNDWGDAIGAWLRSPLPGASEK